MVSKQKKKVFSEIETDFSAKIANSNVFSAQNQVVSKQKKKVFSEIETDFSAKIANSYVFSAQNQVVSKQKKKVFSEIETGFSAKIANSNVFYAQNQVISKQKKRSSPKLRLIFRPKSQIHTLFQAVSRHVLHNFGTQFLMGGGCFQFFTKNRPQKHLKRAILHTSQANGGARAPPPRPWLRYCDHVIGCFEYRRSQSIFLAN